MRATQELNAGIKTAIEDSVAKQSAKTRK